MRLRLKLLLLSTSLFMPSLSEASLPAIGDTSETIQTVAREKNTRIDEIVPDKLLRVIQRLSDKETVIDTFKTNIYNAVSALITLGYVEKFTFKDWEAAYEMGDIVRLLVPYLNPDDFTSNLHIFMQSLSKKLNQE